jgi:hypothetical protein
MTRKMASRGAVHELWRILFILGLFLSVLRSQTAIADPANVRERHATILVKTLSYDQKILNRAGKEVVVAVLYREGEDGAVDEAEAWRQAFGKPASLRFLDLPFRTLKLPLGTTEHLRKAIAQEGIDALFVLGATKEDLVGIQKVTRETKILTLASREEQVTAGLSLGVFVIDGKTTLIVNLTASREEGAVFSSEILKLAKVIK